MKTKIKLILGLAGVLGLCLGAAACTKETKADEYQKQGYKISVTYDANGGSFLNRKGVTIVDMFNPSFYQKDDEGKIHIKLVEPTDSSRPTSGSDPVSLTKTDHFFAGWYQTRTMLTNESGAVVDESGAALEEADGSYVYPGTETSATPAYAYADYWDFGTETVDYSEEDDIVSLTLYAGWVPYYEFNYYYQNDNEWTLCGTTNFDYKTTNAKDSKTSDKDTIWVPVWHEGAMNYKHSYSNGSNYDFPKVPDTTFSKAYLDKECKEEIIDSFEHQGTLDLEHGLAVNRVQNIYLVLEEGEKYKIEKAEQLSNNPNLKGIYEIFNDLDFTGASWPALFGMSTFQGQIFGTEGKTCHLKNIKVKHSSDAKIGGVFGQLSKNAKIENISFENVTFDLANAGTRVQDTSFGLFAGIIEDGAGLSNVAVDGTFKIGAITLGSNYSINLLANGSHQGITSHTIHLQVYGEDLIKYYNYKVNPETVKIDENGDISLTFVASYRSEQPIYDIK